MNTNENSIEEKRISYVYHLIDPRDNQLFYVGKGITDRMYEHERNVRRNKKLSNPHLYNKINQIVKSNASVICKKIIDNISDIDACNIEICEIKKYGRRDLKTGILLNMTDGGESSFGRKCSEKTKKLIGEKAKIRYKLYGFSKEHIKLLSESSKGRRWSKERKEKISKLFKGRTMSDEQKLKLSIKMKSKLKDPTKHPHWISIDEKTLDTIIEMYKEKHLHQIIKELNLNVSERVLFRRMKMRGVTLRGSKTPKKLVSLTDKDLICDLYIKLKTVKRVKEETKFSYGLITRVLKERGIFNGRHFPKTANVFGKNNPNYKQISNDILELICKLYKDGFSIYKIRQTLIKMNQRLYYGTIKRKLKECNLKA